jgi:hypothetical protein
VEEASLVALRLVDEVDEALVVIDVTNLVE